MELQPLELRGNGADTHAQHFSVVSAKVRLVTIRMRRGAARGQIHFHFLQMPLQLVRAVVVGMLL